MGEGSTRRDAARTTKHDEAPRDAEQFDLFGEPLPAPPVETTAEPAVDEAPPASAGSSPPPAPSRPPAPAENEAASAASLWGDEELPPAPAPAASGTAAGQPAAAPRRSRKRGVARAAISDEVAATAAALPPNVRLGTSTWSFPGWNGIVYGDDYSAQKLSRDGLDAYGAHPLLKSVGIDRSFYAPLSVADYLRYAQQVPDDFRFVVKAPASVTDAVVRGPRGEPAGPNPAFLDARIATDDFVRPCLEGLGRKAGALVFQFSPLPDGLLADPAALIERLAAFFAALPPLPSPSAESGEADGPRYAIEIRDASLLTPRFIRALATAGVRYCVGLHARMPDPLRQAAALALLDGDAPGPLVVRWSLHGGFKYEQAKAKYDPFDRLVDEDPQTRHALADLAARYVLAGQPVLITVNNKAEGSAPLSCIELARAISAAIERLRADPA
ncbi:DUF72 domain-containing protein [Burkholderia plantarii]|uniref:DUF72 domain-containing protein n=1 Tax=Burkholderia plantarii TaxID=41899 RepID=UPI0018DB6532|nr:DUF72 domain-containing protein [Burkholderia plantarii]MBI0327474.1 DUF72 domain-containing protein [Burkholderia plantarii]